MTTTRNFIYIDKLNLEGNCPGFHLWEVVASDGEVYTMASDTESGLDTRLFFRSEGRLKVKTATKLGPNPDVTAWDMAHS